MSGEVDVVADDLDEALFKDRLSGRSVRAVAKRYGVSTGDVRRAVLRFAPSIDHASRTEELQLDLARVNALTSRFYELAMAKDTEPSTMCAAASIVVRLSERRSALLGLDQAPARPVVGVASFVETSEPKANSTEKIRAALDWLASTKDCTIEGQATEVASDPPADPSLH